MTTDIVDKASPSWTRDALLVTGLLVAHEGMKRFLAGGGLVAALLSPGGAHSTFTILLALLLASACSAAPPRPTSSGAAESRAAPPEAAAAAPAGPSRLTIVLATPITSHNPAFGSTTRV